MKVLIIAFNNLSKCPYTKPYIRFCQDNKYDCEILYLNRSGEREPFDGIAHEIGWNPQAHKLVNFFHFQRKTIHHLKRYQYDFIIVLTTMPAVLLSKYLSKHYSGKYLVDVRDYTYEKIGFYYTLEEKVLRHSALNVISSPGFKKFLPEAEYQLCHNVNEDYQHGECRRFAPSKANRIVIGYVGSIAYKDQCMKLIQLVEKDQRFCFHLYGNEVGDNSVTDYINAHLNDRICVFGAYKPSEKEEIMSRVDILFNAYGNGNELLDYALSNKLYDAFYMGLPLLTSPNTCMSEEAGDYSYDFDVNHTASLDGLYDWYYKIDADAFSKYANDYMRRVFIDQEAFARHLCETIKE